MQQNRWYDVWLNTKMYTQLSAKNWKLVSTVYDTVHLLFRQQIIQNIENTDSLSAENQIEAISIIKRRIYDLSETGYVTIMNV